ncbi:MAG TPA: response regulator [Patescibacteria group bacterium]|nr:response regulator [Patescibacteria group bacterium]
MTKKKTATILIVEDETSLNDAYAMILKQAGYNVKTAFNGEEALKLTKDFEPDLVLLDLRMPHLDGVGFLRKYHLKDEHPDVKVIVFSNYDMQKEIDQAYQLGAQRYILKTWASPKELLQIVDSTLN